MPYVVSGSSVKHFPFGLPTLRRPVGRGTLRLSPLSVGRVLSVSPSAYCVEKLKDQMELFYFGDESLMELRQLEQFVAVAEERHPAIGCEQSRGGVRPSVPTQATRQPMHSEQRPPRLRAAAPSDPVRTEPPAMLEKAPPTVEPLTGRVGPMSSPSAGPGLAELSSNVSRASASPSANSSLTVRRSGAGTGVCLPDQLGDHRPQAQQPGRCADNTDLAQQLFCGCV